MFKATKPFKDTVTGYDKEPSLRIGKKVPQNAVNLAYYYNPTATNSEKILASDPPRQTIDHRVKIEWIHKFDQASGPNGEAPTIDTFPAFIHYSDEEGYFGKLSRQDETVKWYPEQHIDQKSISASFDVPGVVNKGDEPKFREYADADGYRGTLTLDTVTYEITKTKDLSKQEQIDYSINDVELDYHELFGSYIKKADLDKYTKVPNPSSKNYFWPATINLSATKLEILEEKADSELKIKFNNSTQYANDWEGTNVNELNSDKVIHTSKPVGTLYFDKFEVYPAKNNQKLKDSKEPKEYYFVFNTTPQLWSVTGKGGKQGEVTLEDGTKHSIPYAAQDITEKDLQQYANQIVSANNFNMAGTDTGQTLLAEYEADPLLGTTNGYKQIDKFLNDVIVPIESDTNNNNHWKDQYLIHLYDEDTAKKKGYVSYKNDKNEKTNSISTIKTVLTNAKTNKQDIVISLDYVRFDITSFKKFSSSDAIYKGYRFGSTDRDLIEQKQLHKTATMLVDGTQLDNIDGEENVNEICNLINVKSGEGHNHIDDVHDTMEFENKAWWMFVVRYKIIIGDRPNSDVEDNMLYNVIANYKTTNKEDGSCSVQRTLETTTKVPKEWMAHCNYVGLVDKNWVDYDGLAMYKGSVTKGNSVGNQNADLDDEILMFPDENGNLRQIVEALDIETDEETNRPIYYTRYRNYYRIEAENVYITDVFKDNQPCFYRYRLKRPIYDYRGPDDQGFYNGDAVQIYNSMFNTIPEDYKHNIKLKVAQWEEQTTYDQYNNPTTIKVPKNYFAELYTSFVSSSTDTFKVVYNGYNGIDDDNIIIENGIEEEIYNAPFMIPGIDYEMILVNKKSRTNIIKILNYTPLKDTRKRITFSWRIKAVNKKTGKEFTTTTRASAILNKDYCLPCEYNQFEERAMIISLKLDGDPVYCSPHDLCMYDQALYQSSSDNYQPVINDQDTDFIYSAEIVEINSPGSVNLKCNPDGSGIITAETTLDTGFYDDVKCTYTKKLNIDNPYFAEGEYIHKGYKVKCVDARTIRVNPPRSENLLDSWYPLIQFGHYSRILSQYGSDTKVCYSMPEYDTQHFSMIHGMPFMDVVGEQATILNPHMIKTKCYPLHIIEPSIDDDTVVYNNKFYRIVKKQKTWKEAEQYCKKIGGHLVTPTSQKENDFIVKLCNEYNLGQELWIGVIKQSNQLFKSVDTFGLQYTNWQDGEPVNDNSLQTEDRLYTKIFTVGDYAGQWGTTDNTDDVFMQGFICELTGTINVYKEIGKEKFKLHVANASFSDGVILIQEAISENDKITVDYTYLEENYCYRGYWRSAIDFLRIDLNPNIYHTYSNPNYLPSETSPSKNLFNKVIYFFLRPSAEFKLVEKNGSYYNPNNYQILPVTKTRLVTQYEQVNVTKTRSIIVHNYKTREKETTVQRTREVKKLVREFTTTNKYTNKYGNIDSLNGVQSSIKGSWYSYDKNGVGIEQRWNYKLHTDYFTVDSTYTGPFSVTLGFHDWKGFYIYGSDSTTNTDHQTISFLNNGTPDVISDDDPRIIEGKSVHEIPQTYTIQEVTLVPGMTYYVSLIVDARYPYKPELNNYTFDLAEDVTCHLGDVSENSTYKMITETYEETEIVTETYDEPEVVEEEYEETETRQIEVEEEYTEYEAVYDDDEYSNASILYDRDDCIYHKIDDAEPNDDIDIMIGSVYIRQNTSLHSTIVTDSRTRGGGILESIPDSLRQELEPESDFYLDIGYYDGKPYQENGVIIVRLDNRLLKEYGGKFTVGDIETKVKRWLGIGVYPIIEFVDSYKKQDLPQYTLEIEDSYTNVMDIIPEIYLECVGI